MSGRTWLTDVARQQLARAVATARRNRVPWKVIERTYNRSRWQLQRYMREQRARNAPKKARNAPSAMLNEHAGA